MRDSATTRMCSCLKVDAARYDGKEYEISLQQGNDEDRIEHGQGRVEAKEPDHHEHKPAQESHVQEVVCPDVDLRSKATR